MGNYCCSKEEKDGGGTSNACCTIKLGELDFKSIPSQMKTFEAGFPHKRIRSEISAVQMNKKHKSNRHKKVRKGKNNLANED